MRWWMASALLVGCADPGPDLDADEDGDGFVLLDDCNDADPSVHPGATEIVYDGIDNDCDIDTLDDDLDGDGFPLSEDCDDEDAVVGGPEVVLDGIDNDCDPLTYDDPERVAEVCARWTSDRADLNEGTWSGALDTCDAGDVSDIGRDNALRIMNLYRWLVDLPPVQTSAERNESAQACALMMRANNDLDHFPPDTWSCYTALGAVGAARSNIATAPGVRAVDLYMIDPGAGNAASIGHRRWILSNWLGDVGLGSTDRHSCMYVAQGGGDAGAEWTAWPPPGPVPLEAFVPSGVHKTLDETAWTIQSDTIDFTDAVVEVYEDGVSVPVTTATLGENFGSRAAIAIRPQGWMTDAGHDYTVVVTGPDDLSLEYDVTVVDCSAQ